MGRSFFLRHWRHAALLMALLFTGIGLFAPALRRAMGPALPYVQALHAYGGVLYGLGLAIVALRLFPWPPRGGETTHRTAFWLVMLLFLSGLGLLFGNPRTRDVATLVHAAAAAGLVVWLALHLLVERPNLAKARPERPGMPRRALLRWGVGSALVLPFLYYLPGIVRLFFGGIFRRSPVAAFSDQGALPGFIPYTVVGGFPAIPRSAWRLAVRGFPNGDRTLTFSDYETLPQVEQTFQFVCVTGWSVSGVKVRGVDLLSFLRSLDWNPEETPWVVFSSGDGVYRDALDAKQILSYRPLLAGWFDGAPLPRSQGAPVRLLVPGMYGYKSVKWLIGIEAMRRAPLGYWEVRGYPEDARIGSFTGL